MDTSEPSKQRVNSTTTAHGLNTYMPLPPDERRGIALCLSGGGYRAALFHLGSLRRLHELGILAQVDTITSVSGGSVFAALLARCLMAADPGASDHWSASLNDWDEKVAQPVRELAGQNIRTLATLSRYHPRNWIQTRFSNEALSARYAELISRESWAAMPSNPRFVMCATDMEFGDQWMFDSGRKHAGSNTAGFATPAPDEWSIARVVAASSALPGVFVPIRLSSDAGAYTEGTYRESNRGRRVKRVSLTDGGMYDNLGLEPVWRDHRVVLVSDGGPTFASWQSDSFLWGGMQHAVILLDQVTGLRKRWLISNFQNNDLAGTYWGIGSIPHHYEYSGELTGYPEHLIRRGIERVRIDFDSFSEGEIAVIENQGYIMTEVAIQSHASGLVRRQHAPSVPHPEWMDEGRAAHAVRRSDRISLLGRGKPV